MTTHTEVSLRTLNEAMELERESVGAEGQTQAVLFHTCLHKINLPDKSKQINQRHKLYPKSWTATRKWVFYLH